MQHGCEPLKIAPDLTRRDQVLFLKYFQGTHFPRKAKRKKESKSKTTQYNQQRKTIHQKQMFKLPIGQT